MSAALPPPIAELVARSTTSAACDVLVKRGLKDRAMAQRVRQLGTHVVAGYALTIERRAADAVANPLPNARMVEAIESAAPGTVLVCNEPGRQAALWGGLMAAAAVQKRLGGIVADGPVRDPGEIVELGCPCFCTGSVSAGQAGFLALAGIGAPVWCGDVLVQSGDFVFGDVSGVVVVPAGIEEDVLRAAARIEEGDQAALRLIRSGRSFTETMRELGRV